MAHGTHAMRFSGPPDAVTGRRRFRPGYVELVEGTHDFDTADDARIWMKIDRLRYGYTPSGLALGWRMKAGRLKVRILQMTIDGRLPTHMIGGEPGAVARR